MSHCDERGARLKRFRIVALSTLTLVATGTACPESPDAPAPIHQLSNTSVRPVLGQLGRGAEHPQNPTVDAKTGLVIDDGFEVVAQQCTICHSAKLVTQNRGDKAHWVSLIRWMQKTQGLWVFPPKQEATIVDYLAKNYGVLDSGRRPGLAPDATPAQPIVVDATKRRRGRTAIQTYAKQLQSALKGALQSGPEHAVAACGAIAPQSKPQLAGVTVGRTSTRLRNETNTTPSWAEPLLQSYSRGSTTPELVATLPGGGVGVVKPIFTKPLCLQCHGSDIPDGVQRQLAERYPQDQATGYRAGDLRGVFWAEVR